VVRPWPDRRLRPCCRAYRSLHPKRHLDRFSRFSTTPGHVLQTDIPYAASLHLVQRCSVWYVCRCGLEINKKIKNNNGLKFRKGIARLRVSIQANTVKLISATNALKCYSHLEQMAIGYKLLHKILILFEKFFAINEMTLNASHGLEDAGNIRWITTYSTSSC